MKTRQTVVDSNLGPITIVATDRAVTGLYFRHHIRRPGRATLGPEMVTSSDPLLDRAVHQLREYLAGERHEFDLPLVATGDAFQRAVWAIVAGIPRGETITYGDVAEQLGDRTLAYRVGQAIGANPLCIFVPCHRVVGANGALKGYAGGLAIKQALLDLENPQARLSLNLFEEPAIPATSHSPMASM